MFCCRAASRSSAGYVLASELRAHGVDFTFAPVLDVDWNRSRVIGDRAFHSDPRVVAMLASHLMQGLALAGMSNCGKHFPGHGWAEADSHVDLPSDERAPDVLLGRDAAPYRWLGPQLASVMPAHVVYPAIDAIPAGFSSRWIDMLRNDLGFAGAIFSDDLLMAGAAAMGSVPERAHAALAAGCDLVLVCNDLRAMDDVMGQLRWQRPPRFDERIARLVPRGPVPASMAKLADSELYRLARADIDSLVSQA